MVTQLLARWKEIPFSKVGDHRAVVRRHRGVCAIISRQFWGQGYLVASRLSLRVRVRELIAAFLNRETKGCLTSSD